MISRIHFGGFILFDVKIFCFLKTLDTLKTKIKQKRK